MSWLIASETVISGPSLDDGPPRREQPWGPGIDLGFCAWSYGSCGPLNLRRLVYGLVVSSGWKGNSDKGLVDCECLVKERWRWSSGSHGSLEVFCFRQLLCVQFFMSLLQ